tara:strand:- start:7573 stop:8553 length:981 start_codon:yes stop_codon:yes gene_type:complete
VRILITILFSLFLSKFYAQVLVGPYAPPAGQQNSTAIHKDSTVFIGWGSTCSLARGYQDISNSSLGLTTVGTNNSATEKSGLNGVVSLGDAGSATLTFNGNITNGIGADFAVFENSFSDDFLELAFVEVSSDGINFFRFESVSLVSVDVQTSGFGVTDATEIYNLAGKYRGQYGTPFDLDELNGISGLDINAISHVKVIDVIGNINSTYVSYDSQNNPINDPWPTPFASGGFDLDAIGVINFIPISIKEESYSLSLLSYPNPVVNVLNFDLQENMKYNFILSDLNGRNIKQGQLDNELDVSKLNSGIYFLKVSAGERFIIKKIIKN